MRGRQRVDFQFLPMVVDVESKIPANHPLRTIRRRAEQVIEGMDDAIERAYSELGRPSIPPEHLMKALLLQALYTIRSERQLCEQLEYNLLYRWFLRLSPEAPVWDHSTFTQNRDRFAEKGLLRRFFDGTVTELLREAYADRENFSVDGSLIKAHGSMKSFQPREAESAPDASGESASASPGTEEPAAPSAEVPGEGEAASEPASETLLLPVASPVEESVAPDASSPASAPASGRKPGRKSDTNGWQDFKGKKRKNETHESKTDPDAMLARRSNGQASILAHSLDCMTEKRYGILLDIRVLAADGHAERAGAMMALEHVLATHGIVPRRLGADAGYDDGAFLLALENFGTTPLVPIRGGQVKSEGPEADARRRALARAGTREHLDAQIRRRRIEPVIGWIKNVAGLGWVHVRGRWKIQDMACIAGAAYNLMRGTNLALAAGFPA